MYFFPILVGVSIAIAVYVIIKATHNNPKVIKKIGFINLFFSSILAIIILVFLVITLI